MKYTLDYATRMLSKEKKLTSMEYGLIFHVTCIGGGGGGNFRGIWADIPRYAHQEILLYLD